MEIRRPLADLGVLDTVDVDRSGHVSVWILFSTPTCPLQRELAKAMYVDI